MAKKEKNKSLDRLAIIGAGDLGHIILRLFKDLDSIEIVGFFDDTCPTSEIYGIPVLGGLTSIEKYWHEQYFSAAIIAIGYNYMRFRQDLFDRLKGLQIKLATLIHPTCIISADTFIGEGTLLYPGCLLNVGTHIGNNCILSSGVTIGHDTYVEDNTILGIGVTLSGFVKIKKHCFLGVGTTVIDNVTVETGVQTGGGTVVIDNLAANQLYVGVPARSIRSIPNVET